MGRFVLRVGKSILRLGMPVSRRESLSFWRGSGNAHFEVGKPIFRGMWGGWGEPILRLGKPILRLEKPGVFFFGGGGGVEIPY